MKKKQKILISKDGPYLVSGSVPLAKEISVSGPSGEPETREKGKEYPLQESYALCRCGKSKNPPYCDGSHVHSKFDGREVANRDKYLDQAEILEGPELDLTDAENLCSLARFCHLAGGTWDNVENSDDPEAKKMAIQTACNCPSGRLTVWDKKTWKPIEPKLEPSIGVTEDPEANVSGPLWVKWGIEIESADGTPYETRNRVTLCRCGNSRNKPFCDGSHMQTGFNDGDENLE